MRIVVVNLIKWLRRALSLVKPYPTCRYLPTCSEYAQIAVRKRGCVTGLTLSAYRILRCNPFSRGGIDEVPTGKRDGSMVSPCMEAKG